MAGAQDFTFDGQVMNDNAFTGVAVMNDGSQYYYKTYTGCSDTLLVTISKTVTTNGEALPSSKVWSDYSSSSGFPKLQPKNLSAFLWKKMKKIGSGKSRQKWELPTCSFQVLCCMYQFETDNRSKNRRQVCDLLHPYYEWSSYNPDNGCRRIPGRHGQHHGNLVL